MLAQHKIDAAKLSEPTVEIIEAVAKQSLCFKALQNASGERELTQETVQQLHEKASILTTRLTKENIHVLDEAKIMKEFLAIDVQQAKSEYAIVSLTSKNCDRIVNLNRLDIIMERQSQIQQNRESEHLAEIEKSKDYGMER
jgi:hypothetical protein